MKKVNNMAQDLVSTIGQRILDDWQDWDLDREREKEEQEQREYNLREVLKKKSSKARGGE